MTQITAARPKRKTVNFLLASILSVYLGWRIISCSVNKILSL